MAGSGYHNDQYHDPAIDKLDELSESRINKNRGKIGMKNLKPAPNTNDMAEPGEEELAMLIKEAGAAARVRKKQTMEKHYKKFFH